ncbi:MAG: class I SAM-dependent methyltransferase [Myxococcota bacterium]
MLDYELIDYGKGLKFERFGSKKLIRPEGSVQKQPKNPIFSWKEDSACRSQGTRHFEWDPPLEPWVIEYDGLKLELRVTNSKNIGVFPEQEANWQWLAKKVQPGMKILNLFAYTGAATMICARAGAEVCHVDASKGAVRWASDNAKLSGLGEMPIRWIVEDAMAFLRREATRGRTYDGVILDPPPFGKADADNFLFKRDIGELLGACKRVLPEHPKLFLLNSYAMNLEPEDLRDLVARHFKGEKIETGELKVGDLALSTYARF